MLIVRMTGVRSRICVYVCGRGTIEFDRAGDLFVAYVVGIRGFMYSLVSLVWSLYKFIHMI